MLKVTKLCKHELKQSEITGCSRLKENHVSIEMDSSLLASVPVELNLVKITPSSEQNNHT